MNEEDQLMLFEDECVKRDTVDDNTHPLDPRPSTSNMSGFYSQQFPLSEPENSDSALSTSTPTLNCSSSSSLQYSLLTTLSDKQTSSYYRQQQKHQQKQHNYHHHNHRQRHYSSSVTPLTTASELLSAATVAAAAAVPHAKTAKKFCASADVSALPQVQCSLTSVQSDNSFTTPKSLVNLAALSRRTYCQPSYTVNTNVADQAASEHHLFPEMLMSNDQLSVNKNSAIWDQWLCCLATSLTPSQWQTYWTNYLALFGTSALPPHIVRFFNTAAQLHLKQQSIWIDERQRRYGKQNFPCLRICTVRFFFSVLETV